MPAQKTIIRLLKEWQNGSETYPEGQCLSMADEHAEGLIKQGIAEEYKAEAGDIPVPSDKVSIGMSPDDVKSLITQVLKATEEKRVKTLPNVVPNQDDLIKTGGFRSFGEFAQSVYQAGLPGAERRENPRFTTYIKAMDALVRAAGTNVMVENTGSDGGFLVPTEFAQMLLMNSLEASIVQPRAMVLPMQTNHLLVPAVNETSRASSVFGGVIIYRPGEAKQKTSSKPALAQIELTLHKLIGLVYMSDELLQDSPISIGPLLNNMFSNAIAWYEDDDFINGTGAGMALGALNAACLVSVTKETGQAADTIVAENIDKMYARMYGPSRGKAVWLANDDTYPQLAALSRPVGTGGSTAGLLQSMPGSPEMTLCGKPLILTEHMQTVGDKGDILLADWSQYIIGNRAGIGIEAASSIHIAFDYDETAFRFVKRSDGQPWWTAALTPKNSSNTLSPFVTLNARA